LHVIVLIKPEFNGFLTNRGEGRPVISWKNDNIITKKRFREDFDAKVELMYDSQIQLNARNVEDAIQKKSKKYGGVLIMVKV